MTKRCVLLKEIGLFLFIHPLHFLRWLLRSFYARRIFPEPGDHPVWRSFCASLSPVVRAHLDERWQHHRPGGARSVPLRIRKTFRTDVLYTGMLKPDAEKDLFALRRHRPDLHITAVHLWPFLTPSRSFIFRLCDRVQFVRSYGEFVRLLLSTEANALVFQGGEDQFGLLLSCLWPGRLVWQVRDTFLRQPRPLIDGLTFERSKVIAERADAMVSFHAAEAWQSVEGVHFRSPPHCIPPLCVPELGPRRFLPKLSASDGALHIAYAGGVGPRGGSQTHGVTFTHADFYEKFKTITEQGIHVHVYSPHTRASRPGYEAHFALEAHSPFFHLERPLPFRRLLTELTQYDWGIMHVTWQPELLNPGFDHPIQNGLAGHIQSRIPVIVSPTAKGNAALVTQYRRGLVVSEDEIPRLAHLLREQAWLTDHCRSTELEPELLYDVRAFGKAVLGV